MSDDFDPRLAAQYGEHYARAHKAHYDAKAVIKAFTDQHALFIPDPAYGGVAQYDRPGPIFTIPNPVKHRLARDGDTLSCVECGESVHAPSPPKRPLTPMEASLSPFD